MTTTTIKRSKGRYGHGENIDRNGNNEYHNAFLRKDLVISTRKKRIFIDIEDDDDDDDNESNSQYEDIEKIDLQNLKAEKNDDENDFNRYQNEDALQTMDDNKNGNYYYGLNDNNSTPLIYTARKGLRKLHIFSSPENDNQSMEKENLQNENSSKSTKINDNSSPLSVNGVRHTSEKKSGGVETSRICKSLKFCPTLMMKISTPSFHRYQIA